MKPKFCRALNELILFAKFISNGIHIQSRICETKVLIRQLPCAAYLSPREVCEALVVIK